MLRRVILTWQLSTFNAKLLCNDSLISVTEVPIFNTWKLGIPSKQLKQNLNNGNSCFLASSRAIALMRQ